MKHDLAPRGILLKHSERIMLSNTSGRQMMNPDEIMAILSGFERIDTLDTTAGKPRQSLMLIVILKLSALLAANLSSAQPLTAPTLIH